MSPPTKPTAPNAELRKLAHTLDVDESALDMLGGVSDADLRALRKQVGDALFRADRQAFVRVAALSKTVPTGVAAKLTEAVLPPLLAARTTELLDPRKAAELVTKISPAYLGRVAAHLDAGRAPEVIAAMPIEVVVSVGAELARRKEWVVIGGFVSVVTPQALGASVAGFDGEQLLRIGYVLEDATRLDDIGGLLSDEQIDQLLAAAPEHDLWAELDALLAQSTPPRIERLATRLREGPQSVRDAYATAGKLAKKARATLAG